jgi:DNA-binding XRE family transcriptional regulator
MAKKFEELRKKARARDPDWDAKVAAERRAIEDALALAELRQAQEVTQVELAGRLDVTQANISSIEQRVHAGSDIYISTLAEYVEALGGRLELHAVFGDSDIPIAVGHGARSSGGRSA